MISENMGNIVFVVVYLFFIGLKALGILDLPWIVVMIPAIVLLICAILIIIALWLASKGMR